MSFTFENSPSSEENAFDNSFEIEVSQRELTQALSACSAVIEKRNIVSVLSYAKLQSIGQELVITAANETMVFIQKISATVRKSGTTTVDVATLMNVIRKLSDAEISMKEVGSHLLINSLNSSFSLTIIDHKKFSNFLLIENATQSFSLETRAFIDLVKYTHFSMLNNETRYNLNGVSLHSSTIKGEKKVIAASTDGHRLSIVHTRDSFPNVEDFNIILPAKLVNHICNIFENEFLISNVVHIKIDQNKIELNSGKVMIVSKLINAVFPQYSTLIPKNNNMKLKVNSKILCDAINRVITITTEKFRAVKFNISCDQVEISAYGEGRGKAVEVINRSNQEDSLYSYEGESISIGFNSRYVLDVLEKFKNSIVEFNMQGSLSSALIRSQSLKEGLFVVMPIKV